ncbi:fatty acid desaturase [Kitasatospora sp. MAA4]|uniref:fatty acid desaturase family protein n=1 Tax=Kitasatospora sp. MAA4 TaxID=3035093 RepID=UPI0024767A4D|nr:fatty acid desaturase family protein [Kitasatospora sp. MAA4]MDH6130743.1 fatty acid desaturase [Kitasatospora sp. MAA4]
MSDIWANEGKRYRPYRSKPEIENQIRELNQLDNWHGLLAFAEDAFWISAAVASCYLISPWLYPLALVLIGSRMRALATILHESAHGVLAANRGLNLVLGTVLSAYPIFQQHYSYKRSHVAIHHPRLGNPELDPDLRFFIAQGVYEQELTARERWMKLVVRPAFGSRTLSFVRYLVVNRLGGKQDDDGGPVQRAEQLVRVRRDKVAFLAFWALVLGALAWDQLLTAFCLFWLVPYLTSFQIVSWYIELAEHTPLVRDNDLNLYMTRNRKSRGLERFLTAMHGESYHLDHHLDPRTPFWNMHKAHLLRLADPDYAAWDAKAGGLFQRGPQGQESAISAIIRTLPRDTTREPAKTLADAVTTAA